MCELMTMNSTDFPLWTVPVHLFSSWNPRCQDACKMYSAYSPHFPSPLSSIWFNIMKCQIYKIKMLLEKNLYLQLTKLEKKRPFINF